MLLAASRGEPLKPGERLVPGDAGLGHHGAGGPGRPGASPCRPGRTAEELAAFVADPAERSGPAGDEAVSKPGETVNAALGVPFTLQPGE